MSILIALASLSAILATGVDGHEAGEQQPAAGELRLVAPVEPPAQAEPDAAGRPWLPLAAATLTAEDLARVGWDEGLALRYARARAGSLWRADRVYVDGLPATAVPAAKRIERVSINADPFSVMFSETDQNIIEVFSAPPQRNWWLGGGAMPRVFGGRNPLAPSMRARLRAFDVSGGGPVPATPLGFSASLMLTRGRDTRPIVAASGAPPAAGVSESHGHAATVAVGGHGPGRLALQLALSSAAGVVDAAEVGGFVHAEAATGNAARSREARLTLEAPRGRLVWSGGVVFRSAGSEFRARTHDLGWHVAEDAVRGGAPAESLQIETSNLQWTARARGTTTPWLVGVNVATERNAERLQPNPNGQLTFGSSSALEAALTGQATAVWTRLRGVSVHVGGVAAAQVFAEREWRRDAAFAVRAGVRAEAQSGFRPALSPRLSVRAAARGLSLHHAVGLFRQDWSNDTLVQATRFGPNGPARLVSDVRVGEAWDEDDGQRVYGRLAGDLTRPFALMTRHGVSASRGVTSWGVEYTFTAGINRAGSRRVAVPDGWVDLLESNRRLRRHQVRARGEATWRGATLVAHYEWVSSRDNSDGAFAFPERQDDLAREWARSTGVSPHNVQTVVALPRMGGIDAGAMFAARSRAPFDVRSGLDLDGTRLFLDRGGRPRNDGLGPAYRSLDAYAHRRLAMPGLRTALVPFALDITISGENLLAWPNYAAVGAITGSAFFGLPYAAHAGRTLRASVRLTR